MRLLYIEDEPFITEMNLAVLAAQRPDVEAITVKHSAEAKEQLRTGCPFNLIVCDLIFPGPTNKPMDVGIDFYAVAQAHSPATPFCFLSGNNCEYILAKLAEQELALAANCIFIKAMQLSDMIEVMIYNYPHAFPPEDLPSGKIVH